MRKPHWQIALLTLSIAWLLTGNTCKTIRDTHIVSFDINPNPITRGNDVTIAWQAEFVGLRDGEPYCTLQRTFNGQPAEAPDDVPCIGSRTDQIDATETATSITYRFSALRRTGHTYETADLTLDILHANVTIAPTSITLEPGATHDFTATITGITDTTVTWDPTCGTINGSGTTITYTAPTNVPDPPTCQVTATSATDPMASATATVTIAYGAGAVIWTRQFGTSDDDSAARAVAVDGSGNVLVVGFTRGALGGPHAGGWDAFVRKFDAAGTALWTHQFGTSSDDLARGVAVDASGNVMVAGTTLGSLEGTSAGAHDAFIRKLDAAGNALWTRQFGTSDQDLAAGVAVDGSGNVVVVGSTGVWLEDASAGDWDGFVRTYDAAGNLLWTREISTGGSETAADVAADGSGNVVVVGRTSGSLGDASAGGLDAYVRKYDPAGNVQWTRQFGTSSDDGAMSVAVDESGSILVAGYTYGVLQGMHAGGRDAFLRKYDAAGNVLWTRQFGTSSDDLVYAVAVDASGNILVTGETNGSLEGMSAGGYDAFVRKYDPAGNVLWTRQFGTSSDDRAYGVAVDGSGSVLVTGSTDGSLEGVSSNGSDVFVRKYAP